MFDDFRLERGGLFRLDQGNRKPVALGSRALDLLWVLAERAGEIVTKETIFQTVWAGTTVEAVNLTVQISALRRVIDRWRPQGSYIQTLPRRGYRLVAEVTTTKSEAAKEPVEYAPPDKPSIAVLPFANLSGDPAQDYFADGMTEEIIAALSRLRWLLVIARNSSFTYKGRAVDVRLVGRELGVHYVLEGSVRRAGTRVRFTGQLIETASGTSIWGDRVDGVIDDIFELQDRMASRVAGAIEPQLQFAEISRTRSKPVQDLTAYDLYLRALAESLNWDQKNCGAPLPLLRQALEIDPLYTPAAGMFAGIRAKQLGYGVRLQPEEIVEALKLAHLVIETGTEDAEALAWSGYALASLAGDRAGALRTINRALMLNPNSAFGWWACALIQYYDFEPEEAIRAIERAIRLSPVDPYAHGFRAIFACALMLAGRHNEAVGWIDQSLHEQPRHPFYLRIKVALCGHLNESDEARRWTEELLDLIPQTTIAWFEAFATKFMSAGALGVWLEGFRKAGLPEA